MVCNRQVRYEHWRTMLTAVDMVVGTVTRLVDGLQQAGDI